MVELITVSLTWKMWFLAEDEFVKLPTFTKVSHTKKEVEVKLSQEDLMKLCEVYANIVNSIAAYRNTVDAHTSALAACKRLRRAFREYMSTRTARTFNS